MLSVTAATIFDVAIPFRFEFRHARASRDRTQAIVLRLSDDDGRSGYGECAPREYVTGESTESVVRALLDEIFPRAWPLRFGSFEEVVGALESALDRPGSHERPAALCAFELALLDLAGKVFARSAGSVCGDGTPAAVRYGGVVPVRARDVSRALCEAIRDFGLADVKLKVGADAAADDRLVLEARAILGPGRALHVDANGAWSAEDALARIEALASLGIETVEQPVAPDDLEGWIWLKERSPLPIVADESLVTFDSGRVLVESGACHGFNVRVSKCGGLVGSARLRDLARTAGLSWMLGCQVGETAILSAAGRQLATRSAGAEPDRAAAPTRVEGSYGAWLLESDIGRREIGFGERGIGEPLLGHGLGIEIDDELLERYSRRRFSAGSPAVT